jgi:hypothetical protein
MAKVILPNGDILEVRLPAGTITSCPPSTPEEHAAIVAASKFYFNGEPITQEQAWAISAPYSPIF